MIVCFVYVTAFDLEESFYWVITVKL